MRCFDSALTGDAQHERKVDLPLRQRVAVSTVRPEPTQALPLARQGEVKKLLPFDKGG
jgi:hypothetical protein